MLFSYNRFFNKITVNHGVLLPVALLFCHFQYPVKKCPVPLAPAHLPVAEAMFGEVPGKEPGMEQHKDQQQNEQVNHGVISFQTS